MLIKKAFRKFKFFNLIRKIDNDWNNPIINFDLDKESVIFVGPQTPWSTFHQRPQNVAKELAKKGMQVIYCIAPFEKVAPDNKIYGTKEIDENLIIYSDIEPWKVEGNIKYIYCCYPWHINEAKKIKNKHPLSTLIYDIFDDISLFNINASVKDNHIDLLSLADKIFYSADSLKPTSIKKECFYFPNAVDVNHFDRNKVSGKKVCYFGAIDHWFDFDALNFAISENKNTIFYFAGIVNKGCQKRFDELLLKDNAFFLGKVNYDLLPNLFKDCDIGIIPFIKSSLTDAVNPIKLHEYLALGLDVISSPLNEILKYSECVEIYNNKIELSSLIKNHVANSSDNLNIEKKSWEQLITDNFEINKHV